MKKVLFFALTALAFSMNCHAETGAPSGSVSQELGIVGQLTGESDDTESISSASVTYYEGSTFGLNFRGQNWNGMGFEINLMTDDSFDNYAADVNLNYSFGMWRESDKMLLFTLAAGPMLNFYKAYEGGKEKTKIASSLMVDPYFTFKVSKFVISAGYTLTFNKWKFKERGEAFHIGLGYCF